MIFQSDSVDNICSVLCSIEIVSFNANFSSKHNIGGESIVNCSRPESLTQRHMRLITCSIKCTPKNEAQLTNSVI